MAQRPKEHVRARIVEAAASLFAEVGYEAATMAAVAARGGTSIGNVYKYFASKEALLAAVLPDDFARGLKRKTRERIAALGAARDITQLSPGARYHVLAGDLLDHCIEHRARIAILFARANGTPYERFAHDFTEALVVWALGYARQAWPAVRATATLRFALTRIYENFVASIGAAFTSFTDERAIREAVEHLTSYHQGGLRRLFETAHARRGGET